MKEIKIEKLKHGAKLSEVIVAVNRILAKLEEIEKLSDEADLSDVIEAINLTISKLKKVDEDYFKDLK